jgi:putative nucleotidyltransferase with HDIG domain
MGERIVKLVECKAGMTLSRHLFNEKGVIVLPNGSVLNDAMIDKLTMHEIDNIYISEEEIKEEFTEDTPSMRELKKEYTKKIKMIKNVFNNLSEGKNIETAKDISLSIVEDKKSSGEMLRCMSQIKSIDDYVYVHSLNVASLCFLMGEWMGMSKKDLEELTLAGLMHDIGKAKISKDILNKASLTEKEKKEIENHPIYGYNLVKENTSFSQQVCDGILMHHEREDGTGYPQKLSSEKISQIAKIISVADIYSAITFDRVYKRADTPFAVFSLFESPASQKFDPLASYILISNIAKYYVGDRVRLSNGKTGTIVFIDSEFISRPVIKYEESQDIIDLKVERNIFVEKML